jgi:hypothetical protein
MTIVSILILGSISLADVGDASLPDAKGIVASVAACWERVEFEETDRNEPSSFLCEEEDEDDTFDDAPPAWGDGRDPAVIVREADSPHSGRRPVRVASRSASPTLRMRC